MERCFGDSKLALELLGMFSDRALNGLDAIDEAVTQGNRDALVKISHTIKGVYGNLASPALLKVIAEIDREYRQLDCDAALLLCYVNATRNEVKCCLTAVPSLQRSITNTQS